MGAGLPWSDYTACACIFSMWQLANIWRYFHSTHPFLPYFWSLRVFQVFSPVSFNANGQHISGFLLLFLGLQTLLLISIQLGTGDLLIMYLGPKELGRLQPWSTTVVIVLIPLYRFFFAFCSKMIRTHRFAGESDLNCVILLVLLFLFLLLLLYLAFLLL